MDTRGSTNLLSSNLLLVKLESCPLITVAGEQTNRNKKSDAVMNVRKVVVIDKVCWSFFYTVHTL